MKLEGYSTRVHIWFTINVKTYIYIVSISFENVSSIVCEFYDTTTVIKKSENVLEMFSIFVGRQRIHHLNTSETTLTKETRKATRNAW